LAEGFQKRRLKCEKLTDDGCQVMAKAQIAFGKERSTLQHATNYNLLSRGLPLSTTQERAEELCAFDPYKKCKTL
jgi:hypothetical protein